MSKFVHLHVHTEFSLLDGLSKIPKLVTQAKIMGMKHLALTDHGCLYGAIKFYKECKAEGINPIIGCEMYIAKRSLKDKEAGKDSEYYHLTVLAQNEEGYRNLMRLVTFAHVEGFYYRPRIDKETLSKYSKGLIALSGCNSSEISKALVNGNYSEAKKLAKIYTEIFTEDSFYLEVQKHEFAKFRTSHEVGSEIYNELSRMHDEETKILSGVKKLAKDTGLNVVATNDIHYVLAQDAQAQDAIVCIQTGKNIQDVKRLRMIDSPTFYLKSAQEMESLFGDMPDAIANTVKIAEKVQIEIPLGKVAFPRYEVSGGKSADDLLRDLCSERIKERVEKVTPEINKRLEYELSVISKKGYSTYFLVVADFVNWSRKQNIISTTRGSASGSLVSFALGITTVNPLFFKLPFERFLNLYRPSLPDIDVDFEDTRRDEVIAYVREKYGHDKVAQIGTFGTMMARAAVRDVARVLGWPYSKADRIAKMIPIGAQGFQMSIDIAKKQNRDLGNLYNQDTEVKELLDLAEKVEGNARHVSIHAAGVVIAPESLTNFTPLQKETTGEKIITQYDMHDIEDTGLVKMDFLGIRNLSILGQAIKIVAETKNIKIDLLKINFNNSRAFQLLAKGETMGLFQLGGSGMTRYLKELKPTSIFDIMAMISLFRPGPMNSIPEFIERKNNYKKIQYFDKRMEDYLDQSYGVIVYQDDVLLTAINIAGYNWEEADNFRKAMGKKNLAEMAKQKEKFITGAVNNGMNSKKAEELFKLIEPFAAYGFNKAHAASYAIIAYQTAYMKANYPVEFMTAVMTAEADDPDKIAIAVNECAKMGILVLPPDINHSDTGFKIEQVKKENVGSEKQKILVHKEAIRFGLTAIKNVGRAAIEAIITERLTGGEFRSLDNFTKRVNLRAVNRKTMESLIKAGAMDKFGKRNAMLKILDDLKASGSSLSKAISEGQGALFDTSQLERNTSSQAIDHVLLNTEEAPKEEILSWERELLGFYLTEHPLSKLTDQIERIISLKIGEINPAEFSGKAVKLAGIIASIRKTVTKVKKEEMCFLKLQDMSGTIEVVVFPRAYEIAKHIIGPDQIVVISGKLDTNEETPILIASEIGLLTNQTNFQEFEEEIFKIALPQSTDRILLSRIYEILKSSPGHTSTYLLIPGGNSRNRQIAVPFTVHRSSDLERELLVLGCTIQE
ncbi:MAG: polymerase III, alpha subunit protein [Candidatus Curtissbacteria bacterium GW2011_GWA1_40_9]|uniref:DNA polymerase III subunit alpha n=1 Tax=Candidatus Curtissbacteria bacterium GW2011_GWA1_40_9 TaxID=1618408 RepID=A0A0G0TTG1_9BACT|nr:MAG: polymerase III, alpha subunit protein [Candidatus Curtissbacteria bacterium GW2011_GWA1_40_9]